MSVALFLAFLAVGAAAVLSPYRIHRVAWPADPPDVRDDVARAVSSLRDLEFGIHPQADRIQQAGVRRLHRPVVVDDRVAR